LSSVGARELLLLGLQGRKGAGQRRFHARKKGGEVGAVGACGTRGPYKKFCVHHRDRDSEIVAFAGLGAFPIMLVAAEGALPRDHVRKASQRGQR
jgi:hypothetical protein